MKKTLIILNEYLSHFWFSLFLLIFGCLFFSYYSYIVVNYSDLDLVEWLVDFFYGFLFSFLIPLGVFSSVIALIILLKYKTENKYYSLVVLLSVSLTISSSFMFISRMSVISNDVRMNQQLLESSVIMKNYQIDRLK